MMYVYKVSHKINETREHLLYSQYFEEEDFSV